MVLSILKWVKNTYYIYNRSHLIISRLLRFDIKFECQRIISILKDFVAYLTNTNCFSIVVFCRGIKWVCLYSVIGLSLQYQLKVLSSAWMSRSKTLSISQVQISTIANYLFKKENCSFILLDVCIIDVENKDNKLKISRQCKQIARTPMRPFT